MNDIILDTDPLLREKSLPVEFPLDFETKKMLTDMTLFLKRSQNAEIAEADGLRPGVGIAAPQLGILKRALAIYVEYGDDEEPFDTVMLNPRIISNSVQNIGLEAGEGCLSVDYEVQGFVPRYNKVTVEYFDIEGAKHVEKFKGFDAIVIQHEIDHLNGVLFYDHISKQNPLEIPENTIVL
jgi:peptide deformylase